MLEVRKSTTLSGTISVEGMAENGTNMMPVVYMSASIGEDGKPSVSKTIQDREAYLANKSQIKQDISEFEDMVDSLM